MNNGLLEVLKVIGWADLPLPIDASYKKKWIKAVVKVRKLSGHESFCLAVNDGNDKPRIIRDFGPTSIITDIISVHPYEEIDRNPVPRFTSDEQIVKYLYKKGFKEDVTLPLLSTDNKTPEQIKADRAKINGYIEEVAMRQAKIMSDINENARNLIEMADPKLKEKNIKRKKYGTATPRKAKGSKG